MDYQLALKFSGYSYIIYTFHIYLSKVSLESEMGYVPTFENLVHLTWNDPINKYICPVFRRWCVLPPEVIFVKAFWSKKTPSIVHKGVSFPTFQNHSPISTPPFPHPPPYQQIGHSKFFLLTEMQL